MRVCWKRIPDDPANPDTSTTTNNKYLILTLSTYTPKINESLKAVVFQLRLSLSPSLPPSSSQFHLFVPSAADLFSFLEWDVKEWAVRVLVHELTFLAFSNEMLKNGMSGFSFVNCSACFRNCSHVPYTTSENKTPGPLQDTDYAATTKTPKIRTARQTATPWTRRCDAAKKNNNNNMTITTNSKMISFELDKENG